LFIFFDPHNRLCAKILKDDITTTILDQPELKPNKAVYFGKEIDLCEFVRLCEITASAFTPAEVNGSQLHWDIVRRATEVMKVVEDKFDLNDKSLNGSQRCACDFYVIFREYDDKYRRQRDKWQPVYATHRTWQESVGILSRSKLDG